MPSTSWRNPYFRPRKLAPGVDSILQAGNARELRNVIERMAIMSPGDLLTADSVPVEIRHLKDNTPRSNLRETRDSAERDHVLRALEDANWNVSAAARVLGMERTNLHKRIRALGLSRTR